MAPPAPISVSRRAAHSPRVPGDTVLHLAVRAAINDAAGEEAPAEAGAPSMLDLLLARDSAPGFAEAQCLHNGEGHMPLHIAAMNGSVAVCDGLLKAKHADSLINEVSLGKGEYANGQWGKKNASGTIERLKSVGSTVLHMAVQALHVPLFRYWPAGQLVVGGGAGGGPSGVSGVGGV